MDTMSWGCVLCTGWGGEYKCLGAGLLWVIVTCGQYRLQLATSGHGCRLPGYCERNVLARCGLWWCVLLGVQRFGMHETLGTRAHVLAAGTLVDSCRPPPTTGVMPMPSSPPRTKHSSMHARPRLPAVRGGAYIPMHAPPKNQQESALATWWPSSWCRSGNGPASWMPSAGRRACYWWSSKTGAPRNW